MSYEIRRGTVEDIERLEPLWQALRGHHATLPAMRPVRTPEASWAHRRRQYLEWLAGDDHTLLLAERDGEPIGYAVVSVERSRRRPGTSASGSPSSRRSRCSSPSAAPESGGR